MDIGNNGLGETRTIIQGLNEDDVDVYAWIGDNCEGCSYSGMGYLGGVCDNQWNYRTSLTRGPSRGVIETAEVTKYHTFDSFHILNVFILKAILSFLMRNNFNYYRPLSMRSVITLEWSMTL